jgi:hypothetical protein
VHSMATITKAANNFFTEKPILSKKKTTFPGYPDRSRSPGQNTQ